MDWYWVISCSNSVDQPMVIDDADLGIKSERLWDGAFVEDWSSSAWMRVKDKSCDGDPDDALQNYLGIPVFSPRLRAACEESKIRGFQFLPVEVTGFDGTLLQGFSVANIIERRPALDRALSDHDVYPSDYFLPARRGLVSGIRRAVLIEEHTYGCDALRLMEFRSSMYVSDRFKELFEDGGFTGFEFDKVRVVSGATRRN